MLLPQTFTMILVSFFERKARSLSINVSIPGFCRPMAFIIPPCVSAILGVGLPGQGTFATPFVVTAPSFDTSKNSSYSMPEPKVPDATVTGFFSVTPAILTSVFIKAPPFPRQRPVRPRRFWYCSPWNGRRSPLSCIRRQGMRRYRRPCVPLRRYKPKVPARLHKSGWP